MKSKYERLIDSVIRAAGAKREAELAGISALDESADLALSRRRTRG